MPPPLRRGGEKGINDSPGLAMDEATRVPSAPPDVPVLPERKAVKFEFKSFSRRWPRAPCEMHLLLSSAGTGRAALGKQAALEAPGKKSRRSTDRSRPCSTATVIH